MIIGEQHSRDWHDGHCITMTHFAFVEGHQAGEGPSVTRIKLSRDVLDC